MSTERKPAGINVLSRTECFRMLSSRPVGRIGVVVEQYPLIIPVNYAMDGETVVIRTAPGTVVAHAHGAAVTFQVDHFDDADQAGWSVLLRGHGESVSVGDADDLIARTRATEVAPWAPGERPLWIRITASAVSGRRITPGEDREWRLGTAAYM